MTIFSTKTAKFSKFAKKYIAGAGLTGLAAGCALGLFGCSQAPTIPTVPTVVPTTPAPITNNNQMQANPAYTSPPPPLYTPSHPAYQIQQTAYFTQLPADLQNFFIQNQQKFTTQLNQSQLEYIQQLLLQQTINPRVVQLISPFKQALKKNWQIYRSKFVEPTRINAGKLFWATHQQTIEKIAQKYQVPAYIIMGVLGVETIYGRDMGSFNVLNSLYTLSFAYPETANRVQRSQMFQGQLTDYLIWAAKQGRFDHLGSYAAAMGMPQFMPSSVTQFAVDEDGDGVINLRDSIPDIAASVANFLNKHGWRANQAVVVDIAPQQYNLIRHLADGKPQPSRPLSELSNIGLTQLQGQSLNINPQDLALIVDLPSGIDTDYKIGLHNFYVITRYNQSFFYAMVVEEFGKSVVFNY